MAPLPRTRLARPGALARLAGPCALVLLAAGALPAFGAGLERVRGYTGLTIGASLRNASAPEQRSFGRRATPTLRRGSLLLLDNPHGGYVALPMPLRVPPACAAPPAPEPPPAAPPPPRPYGGYFPVGPSAPEPGSVRATLPEDSVEMLLGGVRYRQHERALYRQREAGDWVVVEPPRAGR